MRAQRLGQRGSTIAIRELSRLDVRFSISVSSRTESETPYVAGLTISSLHDLALLAATGQDGAWDGLIDRLAPIVWEAIRPIELPYQERSEVWRTVWVRLAETLARNEPPESIESWVAVVAARDAKRRQRLRVTAES